MRSLVLAELLQASELVAGTIASHLTHLITGTRTATESGGHSVDAADISIVLFLDGFDFLLGEQVRELPCFADAAKEPSQVVSIVKEKAAMDDVDWESSYLSGTSTASPLETRRQRSAIRTSKQIVVVAYRLPKVSNLRRF